MGGGFKKNEKLTEKEGRCEGRSFSKGDKYSTHTALVYGRMELLKGGLKSWRMVASET